MVVVVESLSGNKKCRGVIIKVEIPIIGAGSYEDIPCVGEEARGQWCVRRINLYFWQSHYIVKFTSKSIKLMRIAIALLLLLAVVVSAQNCKNCKPASKVATCTDYHCYRCNKNEVLNLDSLLCDCIDKFYRVNG